ncbi:MAG TPA: cytochrome c biogenesis protein DipZ [Steroidobacteraceae bacterium]|jgi:cytochrome c biogenesis protein CcdA/thiol-disulfide isomerase/thioredoxin|nr:cytochrome c biogenesis protein DipZ [Steroidobacteraceae bacterium]
MLLALLAFLGGALTILSPCILPVLPFVFARADRSFARSTLPLLAGMALTFAAIATLAAVGGAWAVRVNGAGRILALVLLAVFGVALLSRRVADFISRPFVAFGNRLLTGGGGAEPSAKQSVLLGVATGFLWAPCAGPILGLILTGAAINGPNAQTSLLLFAYSAGAVASLALATLIGGRVFAALKRSLGAGEWVRRALGVAVLAGVTTIALGWDTGVLTNLSAERTNRIEQWLLGKFQPESQPEAGGAMMAANTGPDKGGNEAMAGGAMMSSSHGTGQDAVEGEMPPLAGATGWLNSQPLTREGLRGKVVVIDFWTYSCINCLRALPYINAWYSHYKDSGLVIIGVHSPEFAFEKDTDNVRQAVAKFGIQYPVALDNDYAIWKAFNNQFWPAHYFIDAKGQIRGHHFGEGKYERSERTIRKLLTEAGVAKLPDPIDDAAGEGISAAADTLNVASPETYLGFERAENFASPGSFAHDSVKAYELPASLSLNQWALSGRWQVSKERARLEATPGRIAFRFRARDLHLVLGPGSQAKAVRFRVLLDGKPPQADHGMDIDANGNGTVREQRLYQLIRQSGAVQEHEFVIEFLDANVEAYSFTFG